MQGRGRENGGLAGFACRQVAVDLSVSPTPVPDIIALSATVSNDGIVSMPVGGAAAFAVASINVGAAAPIIVTADTGSATLPLQATLCQSDPSNGQCLATR